MAEVEEHSAVWDGDWDWGERGDEWSRWWGGTPALWHGALLPRIHAFVPAPTILEIAPGFGRWSQFLRHLCDRLLLVDLAERCIEHCRQRFDGDPSIEFHVNDGRSLPMVADRSVDFAFSFDSLVHVEIDVLEAYLAELARTLTNDGVGLLHHSNLGAHRGLNRISHRVPARLRAPLVERGTLIDIGAWRAESVTAEGFASAASAAGLSCISQELICWEHGRWLIDTISLVTPSGSRWDRDRRVVRNPHFNREAARMARLYADPSAAGDPSAK
jgi:SAM-dependent methyltransferase